MDRQPSLGHVPRRPLLDRGELLGALRAVAGSLWAYGFFPHPGRRQPVHQLEQNRLGFILPIYELEVRPVAIPADEPKP